ncbi:MAG: acylphosphatase [bacterium]
MQELFLKISGQVQGVCFRSETQKLAQSLGLTGWVKNASDGTVEILAQGEKENLKKLEKWANIGAEFADVKKVEKETREIKNKFSNFEIIV